VAEISRGWLATWEKLTTQWPDGSNPLVAAIAEQQHEPVEDEALPGLSLLVSVVAGQPIRPGRLLHDIGDDLVAALQRWEDERRGGDDRAGSPSRVGRAARR
jgi:hypothetical protein